MTTYRNEGPTVYMDDQWLCTAASPEGARLIVAALESSNKGNAPDLAERVAMLEKARQAFPIPDLAEWFEQTGEVKRLRERIEVLVQAHDGLVNALDDQKSHSCDPTDYFTRVVANRRATE